MEREYWDAFWESCDGTGAEWAEHVGRQGIDGWTSDSDVADFALAVWQGRDDEAIQLIRGGLDLSADFFYWTPAEWAASLGSVAALKAMRARDGGTEQFEAALCLAVGCDQLDSAEWLIGAGTSPGGRFLSP